MNARGHAADPDDDDDRAPGVWMSVPTALRLALGWLSVVIGVLNLLVDLDQSGREPDWPYVIFHVVLVVGGVALLALDWLRPSPGTAGYVAGGLVTVTGVVASAVPATRTICCLSGFAVRHGFPFTSLARDKAGGWHMDGLHTVADLAFWAYAGLFALIVVALVHREPAAPKAPKPEERLYIEHPREAHGRTVGPLP
jgi:hypothetical protein